MCEISTISGGMGGPQTWGEVHHPLILQRRCLDGVAKSDVWMGQIVQTDGKLSHLKVMG